MTDEQLQQWREELRAEYDAIRQADHTHVAVGRYDGFKGWRMVYTKADRDAANEYWRGVDARRKEK